MEQNIKSFWEKAKYSATKAADAAGKKATEVVEATKINFQIFDLNTEIEMIYKEIGKTFYEGYKGDNIDEDYLSGKVTILDEKHARIADLKEKLKSSKDPATICSLCGKKIKSSDEYCSACGNKLR